MVTIWRRWPHLHSDFTCTQLSHGSAHIQDPFPRIQAYMNWRCICPNVNNPCTASLLCHAHILNYKIQTKQRFYGEDALFNVSGPNFQCLKLLSSKSRILSFGPWKSSLVPSIGFNQSVLWKRVTSWELRQCCTGHTWSASAPHNPLHLPSLSPACRRPPLIGFSRFTCGWFHKGFEVHTSVGVHGPDLALSRCSELCGISQFLLAPRAWRPGYLILLFLLYYKMLSVKHCVPSLWGGGTSLSRLQSGRHWSLHPGQMLLIID